MTRIARMWLRLVGSAVEGSPVEGSAVHLELDISCWLLDVRLCLFSCRSLPTIDNHIKTVSPDMELFRKPSEMV